MISKFQITNYKYQTKKHVHRLKLLGRAARIAIGHGLLSINRRISNYDRPYGPLRLITKNLLRGSWRFTGR